MKHLFTILFLLACLVGLRSQAQTRPASALPRLVSTNPQPAPTSAARQSAALATTIRYVSTTGTNSTPATAISWATSTTDLQGAIDASGEGDQVWVASGTYKPGGSTNTDRNISFTVKNGVAVYGGFVGNETLLSGRPAINPVEGQPSSTTLSGDIGTVNDATDNSYNVIITNGLNNTALLDGFLITGGYSTVFGGGGRWRGDGQQQQQPCADQRELPGQYRPKRRGDGQQQQQPCAD